MNAKAESAVPLDDDDTQRFYDPNDGIDWEQIIAELPENDDIESEPHAFCTGDYATPEEGIAALWDLLCTLGNGDSYEESIAAAKAASE